MWTDVSGMRREYGRSSAYEIVFRTIARVGVEGEDKRILAIALDLEDHVG